MKFGAPDATSAVLASCGKKHTLVRVGEIVEKWMESREERHEASSPSIAYMGFGGHFTRLADHTSKLG